MGEEGTEDRVVLFNEDGGFNAEALGDNPKEVLLQYQKENWKEILPEEVATHKTLADFKDIDSFGKSYVSAQELVGRKGVIKPAEDAGDEAWTKYWGELGRPETAEGYEFESVEGFPTEDIDLTEVEKEFRIEMHSTNATKEAANAGWKFFQNKIAQGRTDGMERYKSRITTESDALKKEWGVKYDENAKLAKSVIAKFADEGVNKWLVGTNIIKEPNAARLLAAIGAALSEDTLNLPATSKDLNTPLEAKTEQTKMLEDETGALRDKSHPDHEAAVNKFNSLQEQITGKKEEGDKL